MLSEWGWSRPQTLQGFSPLRAMIANLEIHRPTTRVSHISCYPTFLNHYFGNMISKALGCKLPLVIQRGFPIWPNGSFPVSEPQPLAIISQQTSWPLPTIQWMIRESQKPSFFFSSWSLHESGMAILTTLRGWIEKKRFCCWTRHLVK